MRELKREVIVPENSDSSVTMDILVGLLMGSGLGSLIWVTFLIVLELT